MSFVQQTSVTALINGFNSPQSISGTTAGNTLLVPFYHANNSNNGTSISCSDGTNSYTLDIRKDRVNTYTTGVFRLFNISGGASTITLTSSSGTAGNNFWRSTIIEYSALSGLIDTSAESTAQNASSTGPVSVTTGSLLDSSELLIVVAIAETGTNGLANASGFIGRGLVSHLSVNEQITSGTSAVTANCGTLVSAAGWDIVAIPYRLSSPYVPFPLMSKGGIGVQMCQ